MANDLPTNKDVGEAKPPPSHPIDASKKPRRLWRQLMFRVLSLVLSLVVACVIVEVVFRILESRTTLEGEGGHWVLDDKLGFKPGKGWYHIVTPEFDVQGTVNGLYMNDRAWDSVAAKKFQRILALGDSHTYAVGVDQENTWVRKVEEKLNAALPAPRYLTFNAACPGFNLHQYLIGLQELSPVIEPDYVMVGFSYATDLYDLLPPDRGGWVYGSNFPDRDYFDLNEQGILVRKRWTAAAPADASPDAPSRSTNEAAVLVRNLLGHSATFRYYRRSPVALWVGSKVQVDGQSLWPNVEVVVEKELSGQHLYQWNLAFALLKEIKNECDRRRIKLLVVGIPYLPQVYDAVWDSTFAGNPRYSRTAGIDRMTTWCRKESIAYVDTTAAMRDAAAARGHRLHFPQDAHPTVEGHDVIADTVVRANLFRDE
jgi:hypothetical protein